MTDTVKAWIEERRATHSKGTGVLLRNPYELNREYDLWDEDAEAIADAHNNLPRALDALNAVLELCDQWDREVSIPGVPGVECDESFKVRLVIQKAIEGAIND